MKKRFFVVFLLIIFIEPITTYSAEFEYIECSFGYHMPLHGESNLPNVNNYHQRGIIESKGKNKFLNGATYYLEGIQVGSTLSEIRLGKRELGEGRYEINIMDADGDMILGHEISKKGALSGKFTHGTGKYKGIVGNYTANEYKGKSERLKQLLKEHLDQVPPIDTSYYKETRSYGICKAVKGNYNTKNE